MEKTCARCGTTFTIPKAWAKRGDGKFCGRACYFAHQRENPHGAAGKAAPGRAVRKDCPQCGVSFTRPASVSREHCSRACYVLANSVTLTCVVCSSEFRVKRSQARSRPTCSEACRVARQVFRPCSRCGTVFKANHARHAHCSEACRRPPLMVDCPTCGDTFRAQPGLAARFCSVRCYRRHTGETVPERNVRLALDDLGIGYAQEEAIPGWQGPVDFLLADRALVVEVDEPYWHDQVADRDARKDAFMRAQGYEVLRLVATPFYGDFAPEMAGAVGDAIRLTRSAGPVPA